LFTKARTYYAKSHILNSLQWILFKSKDIDSHGAGSLFLALTGVLHGAGSLFFAFTGVLHHDFSLEEHGEAAKPLGELTSTGLRWKIYAWKVWRRVLVAVAQSWTSHQWVSCGK
jgi:hypothetical protein